MTNTGAGVQASATTFVASTTIKSADVNTNFSNINAAPNIDAATINGRQVFTGAGAPSGALGNIGDFYFRTS
jgi:hypothetical protein